MNRQEETITIQDMSDPLLLDLAMKGDYRVQANNWSGFDVYRTGQRYVRTTVEGPSYHLYGFDGYELEWSIDFSVYTPPRIVAAAVRSAYRLLT